jgi:hypothetical protein
VSRGREREKQQQLEASKLIDVTPEPTLAAVPTKIGT